MLNAQGSRIVFEKLFEMSDGGIQVLFGGDGVFRVNRQRRQVEMSHGNVSSEFDVVLSRFGQSGTNLVRRLQLAPRRCQVATVSLEESDIHVRIGSSPLVLVGLRFIGRKLLPEGQCFVVCGRGPVKILPPVPHSPDSIQRVAKRSQAIAISRLFRDELLLQFPRALVSLQGFIGRRDKFIDATDAEVGQGKFISERRIGASLREELLIVLNGFLEQCLP